MEYPQPHIANGVVMVTKTGAHSVAQESRNVHGTACGTHGPFPSTYNYAPFHLESGSLPASVAVAIVLP
eukprot:4591084-Prorocentrum_lima.AAC.1